ncbi:MAG: hypothetical protein QXR55_04095 [Sulfolobales archaeon]
MRVGKVVLILFFLTALSVGFALGYYLNISRTAYEVISTSYIERLIANISNEVSTIRGLSFKEQPNVVIVNSSTVIATWGSEIPHDVVIFGEVLKMTLLAPKEYNISKSYSSLFGMWVAASAGNTIYVVSDNLVVKDPLLHRVLAHELVHILQYQYFSIPSPKSLDESLAIRSLIEGDADIVADTYVMRKGFGEVGKVSKLPLNDPYISIQLIPYIFGSNFIAELLKVGGWELVNKAYIEPPSSMKYVMFPEKYLNKELIFDVTNNVTCNVVYEDVLGPSYIYVMIGKYFNESSALRISSFWVGDKITYCDDGVSRSLYWRVKFTSEETAKEFYKLFNAIAGVYGAVISDGKLRINELVIDVEVSGDEVLVRSYALKW